MVDVSYQMVLSTIQTISLVVGIIYYITIMRNQQRTREQALKAQIESEKARQRELIFQRLQHFDYSFTRAWGDVIFKDPEKWVEVYDPNENLEAWTNMAYLQNRYNNLGIMLKEGVIEPELLFKIFNPGGILSAWAHYKDNITTRRERYGPPNLFEGFEYLAQTAMERYPDLEPRRPRWREQT
jgi:hypothetical protein